MQGNILVGGDCCAAEQLSALQPQFELIRLSIVLFERKLLNKLIIKGLKCSAQSLKYRLLILYDLISC